jgi:diketogulonate reductase-like aldo/keto reductase
MTLYFGTYKLLDEEILHNSLQTAYNTGYRHFDCAELYKNQHMIGNFFKQNNIPRESYWLTSKLSFRVIPKGEIEMRKSLEKTFIDLSTNYIDLMLIHSPCKLDTLAWTILTEYKKNNRIKNIGISNYNIENLSRFMSSINNPTEIYCNQIEFNPFLNRTDLLQKCQDNSIQVITYGNLYKSNELIEMIGQKLDRTKEQILLKYAIQKNLSIVTTATNAEYIKINYNLDFTIEQLDIDCMDQLNENFSLYRRFI